MFSLWPHISPVHPEHHPVCGPQIPAGHVTQHRAAVQGPWQQSSGDNHPFDFWLIYKMFWCLVLLGQWMQLEWGTCHCRYKSWSWFLSFRHEWCRGDCSCWDSSWIRCSHFLSLYSVYHFVQEERWRGGNIVLIKLNKHFEGSCELLRLLLWIWFYTV